MASLAFERVMTEHFDILDNNTRKTLLSIDEADQNKVIDSLTSKLYQHIMDRVYDIDFRGVEETKGDITRIQNYEQLLECINVIKSILIEYHQDTDIPDTILNAISNIRERKDIFMKAFNLKMDLPIVLYNTIVLSIESSTSLIISTSIEFIKDAGEETYKMKFDKVAYNKTSQSLLFDDLEKFNRMCTNGDLDKSLEYVLKSGTRQFLGIDPFSVVGIVGGTVLLLSIIPILRELTFFFFHARQSISDYFDIQADMLQMNAEYLRTNDMYNGPGNKKDVVKRQDKIVKSFRKIANKLAIDNKTAESKAKKDVETSKKKYKVGDIQTDIKLDSVDNDATSSSLF